MPAAPVWCATTPPATWRVRSNAASSRARGCPRLAFCGDFQYLLEPWLYHPGTTELRGGAEGRGVAPVGGDRRARECVETAAAAKINAPKSDRPIQFRR